METITEFLKELTERNQDLDFWEIEGIIKAVVTIEKGKNIIIEKLDPKNEQGTFRIYEEQECDYNDNGEPFKYFSKEYVYQRSGGYGCEDSFYGNVLYPLQNDEYLKIKFSC